MNTVRHCTQFLCGISPLNNALGSFLKGPRELGNSLNLLAAVKQQSIGYHLYFIPESNRALHSMQKKFSHPTFAQDFESVVCLNFTLKYMEISSGPPSLWALTKIVPQTERKVVLLSFLKRQVHFRRLKYK